MDSSVQRRLGAIHGHLLPAATAEDPHAKIRTNETAGEFVHGQRYIVVLPEKLQAGKWNVYRSAHSPLELVNRFADHPEIATSHDNFLCAVQTFRDYKYLGTRIRVDGTIGDYKWMTYGEADTARSAIGSGLCHYGLSKVSLLLFNLDYF